MAKKQINLRDNKEMLELMKILYGNDEVKDDQANRHTNREPRAKSLGKVVESAPDTEGLLLQE